MLRTMVAVDGELVNQAHLAYFTICQLHQDPSNGAIKSDMFTLLPVAYNSFFNANLPITQTSQKVLDFATKSKN